MNIEEEIQKILIKIRTGKEVTVGDDTIIETLLTAYEKEKEERERIGKLYYEANENCIKYEKMIKKEKEKNKELEKQYKILEVEKVRYNIQYLESSISQVPDTVMTYHSIKRDIETLKEQKIKLEKELQELLEEE